MSEVRIRRGDGFEASELVDTIRSPGFARIEARHRLHLDQSTQALKSTKSWDETLRLQGQIEAIERHMRIPYILRSEDAATQKKAP